MNNCKELINSGLLELYVLGETNVSENQLIAEMMLCYPEISIEIKKIEIAIERYAMENSIIPDPIILPFLLATIDYTTRIKNGEVFSSPPLLNKDSKLENYREWIDQKEMITPPDFDNIYAKIIYQTTDFISAIVWIKSMAPQEVHDREFERFLILEGTCAIHIEEETYHLKPGDYLQIPLHKKHHVLVTSKEICKVLLQRIAA